MATPATSCWRFLVPKWKRYHPPNGGRLATLPPADTRSVGFGHTERAVGYHQSLRFVALGKL